MKKKNDLRRGRKKMLDPPRELKNLETITNHQVTGKVYNFGYQKQSLRHPPLPRFDQGYGRGLEKERKTAAAVLTKKR